MNLGQKFTSNRMLEYKGMACVVLCASLTWITQVQATPCVGPPDPCQTCDFSRGEWVSCSQVAGLCCDPDTDTCVAKCSGLCCSRPCWDLQVGAPIIASLNINESRRCVAAQNPDGSASWTALQWANHLGVAPLNVTDTDERRDWSLVNPCINCTLQNTGFLGSNGGPIEVTWAFGAGGAPKLYAPGTYTLIATFKNKEPVDYGSCPESTATDPILKELYVVDDPVSCDYTLTVLEVDLDFPGLADATETDPPGGLVGLNDDDDNTNTVSDLDWGENPVTSEDDLKSISLGGNWAPKIAANGTWSLSWYPYWAVRVWRNADKSGVEIENGEAYPWPFISPLYIEGIATGEVSLGLTAYDPQGVSCSDSIIVTVVSVKIQNGLPQNTKNVAPGKVLWPNADDDDFDGTIDLAQTSPILGENDLVPVNLSVTPNSLSGDATLTWTGDVRVYLDNQTQIQIASPKIWSIADLPGTVFVEGVDSGLAQFTLSALGFDDKMKITVFKVTEVHWKEYPDNPGLTECPAGYNTGSLCIYPEAQNFDESPASSETRRRVRIEGTVTPPPGQAAIIKVYLKNWDVDDRSADGNEIDNQPPGHTDAGPDNRGTDPAREGEIVNGSFVYALSDGTFLLSYIGANGYFKTTRQPGDNFCISASTTPDLNTNWMKQFDADDIMPAGGLVPPVGGAAATQMLTVRRTLYIELDSMAGPILPGDGPFDGAGIGNDDVNTGNPTDSSIALLSDEYAKAYVRIATVPNDQDTRDEETFQHNLANYADLTTDVRDAESTALLWVVHVLSAYEGVGDDDLDPNGEAPIMGGTKITSVDACWIFNETIRDISANYLGAVAQNVIEPRVVLHESLHHFHMAHTGACWDSGALDPVINATGTAAENGLNDCQIDKIRSEIQP